MTESQTPAGDGEPTPEQQAELASVARAANEKLLDAGQVGTNYAFNLGCYIGLLPVGILTIGVFLVSKGSWAAAGITLLITILVVIALANTAAFIAGRNALQRTFIERLSQDIEGKLAEILPDLGMGTSRAMFWQIASETLPAGSPLLQFAPPGETELQTTLKSP